LRIAACAAAVSQWALSRNKPLVVAVIAGLVLAFVPFLIPGLRTALAIEPLVPTQWLVVFGVAIALLVVVEIGKFISNSVISKKK